MSDYSRFTREELIERLSDLETKAARQELQQAERVTEQKRAKTALRDSEARLRAILETAVEGIITIDERGIIESVNPAAESMFGYKARELTGRSVNVLMPSPYREEHDRYVASYLRTGQAKIIGIGREVVGRRKDGTTFPMDLSVSEIRLQEKRLFTGFVRDIGDRRRLEKEILEVSDREQRRIGQDLHDGLGQHLAGIELMSQALQQTLARRSRKDAAPAAKIARHVRTAISHTRMLARGLSPVLLESEGLMCALQELARNTENLFNIRCDFRCDPPVLMDDNTAATHLYRIAQEAVSNAVKHGGAKRVSVELSPSDGEILLNIKDDGTGFPAVPKGKGMGVQTMRYRATMIGGSLAIRSQPGAGTTVTCAVPKSAAPKQTPRKS